MATEIGRQQDLIQMMCVDLPALAGLASWLL